MKWFIYVEFHENLISNIHANKYILSLFFLPPNTNISIVLVSFPGTGMLVEVISFPCNTKFLVTTQTRMLIHIFSFVGEKFTWYKCHLETYMFLHLRERNSIPQLYLSSHLQVFYRLRGPAWELHRFSPCIHGRIHVDQSDTWQLYDMTKLKILQS